MALACFQVSHVSRKKIFPPFSLFFLPNFCFSPSTHVAKSEKYFEKKAFISLRGLFSVDHLDEEEIAKLVVVPEGCRVGQRRSKQWHRLFRED